MNATGLKESTVGVAKLCFFQRHDSSGQIKSTGTTITKMKSSRGKGVSPEGYLHDVGIAPNSSADSRRIAAK